MPEAYTEECMQVDDIDRIHIGCGPHNIMSGWWNVDVRQFPGIDEVFDVRQPWPWRGLRYVYGEHFVEHLELSEALSFLENAGTSLAPGGTIRLSTPNLAWVMLTHFRAEVVSSEQRVEDTLFMNRAFHGWGHRFLFTKELLNSILSEMGFCNVSFHAYGESNVPDLRGLERHGGYSIANGQPSVIICDASRNESTISVPDDFRRYLLDRYLRFTEGGH